MRDLAPAFARSLADQHRSPRTIKTYGAILGALTDFLGTRHPTEQDLLAFIGRPRLDGQRRSAPTRNQEVAALRALAKFMSRTGGSRLPVEALSFVREPPHDPPFLTAPELRRLFNVAAAEPDQALRARNLSIVALLTQNGLRLHELIRLNGDQVDLQTATLVAVRGKGDSVHDLPMNAPTAALVAAWLERRPTTAASAESALFVSARGTRVSPRSVQRLFVRLRVAMGTPKKVTPHTGRHSTATLALTTGSDISTTADLLRHADLNVTRRYLHLVDERKREAVRRLAIAIPLEVLPAIETSGTNAVRPHEPDLDGQHLLDDAA